MKTKLIALALGVLFAMPCVLHAEEVDVYNAQGMHMMHCDNCNVQSLNLPKGIYIYRIHGGNESYTKKIIK